MRLRIHCRYWFSLFFAFVTDKALVACLGVEAGPGETVILPCLSRHYEVDVFWRYENTKTVYDIINGEVEFTDQDPDYRNRVKGFFSEFTKGNYSIRLMDVKYTDAGIYSCLIPDVNTFHVELKIKDRAMKIRQHRFLQTSGEVRRQSDHLVCFILTGLTLWFF